MDEQNLGSMVPPPPQAAPTANMQLQGVGSLFRNSWSTYKSYFGKLFPLILLWFIANSLPLLLSLISDKKSAAYIFGSPILGIASVILGLIISVGIIAFVVEGGTLSTGSAIGRGSQLFGAYIWAGILVGLVVFGGVLLLIVPGIIMSVMLFLTAYAVVAERKRGLDALAQSWHYVKGHGWAVFGRMFVIGLVTLVIVVAAVLITGGDFSTTQTDQTNGNLTQGILANIFIAFLEPFSMIYLFLIYSQLREMKGDMDEATLKSRKKKLLWFSLAGIIFIVLVIALLIFGAAYFATHKFNPQFDPGTTSGIFRVIY